MEFTISQALPEGGFTFVETFEGTEAEAQAEINAKAKALSVQVIAEFKQDAITSVLYSA